MRYSRYLLGAGGFNDGRGLVAALSYGASGIAMGTRFLLMKAPFRHHQRQYIKTPVTGTVVTKVDGYPQRVIRTDVVEQLERSSIITRLFRALGYAFALRKHTETSTGALIKEGLAMRENQNLTWSQLAMAANAPMLTKASMVDGNLDVGILPTGQVVGVIEELPTVEELVKRVMQEAQTHSTSYRLK